MFRFVSPGEDQSWEPPVQLNIYFCTGRSSEDTVKDERPTSHPGDRGESEQGFNNNSVFSLITIVLFIKTFGNHWCNSINHSTTGLTITVAAVKKQFLVIFIEHKLIWENARDEAKVTFLLYI